MKMHFLMYLLVFSWSFTLHAKIAVVCLAAGDEYKNIVQTAVENKRQYCELHGYDFYCGEQSLDPNRPIPWSKILLLLEVMKDSSYDWIFWSDADSLIMNLAIPLEDFLDENYKLVISRDPNGLNSGQFFLKNCEYTKQLLTKVYGHTESIDSLVWENEAFVSEYVNDENLRAKTKVVPQRLFNSYPQELFGTTYNLTAIYQPGDFILHFASFRQKTLNDLILRYAEDVVKDAPQISLDSYLGIYGFILSPEHSINNEGYMTDAQKEQYNELFARHPEIKSIAEIGLNGGHWMVNALKKCPQVQTAVSFDINQHSYTPPAVEYCQRFFKNSFKFVEGNSLEAVPKYSEKFPEHKFDLLYVDGCHAYEYCYKDIINFRKLAHKNTILCIDDYNGPEIKDAVSSCESQGIIKILQIHNSIDKCGYRSWVEATYVMD